MGELSHDAKEEIEERLKTLDERGEIFTLLSEEELGLSDSKTRKDNRKLVKKFCSLKATYLKEPHLLNSRFKDIPVKHILTVSQLKYIPFMIDCEQLADEIRKEETQYSQQEPNDAISTKQLKPKKKRRTQREREEVLFEAVTFLTDNPTIPQAEVEKQWNLERGALSKKNAVALYDEIQQRQKVRGREKVSKDVGDDFLDSQQNRDK